jgi:hypothetical protein
LTRIENNGTNSNLQILKREKMNLTMNKVSEWFAFQWFLFTRTVFISKLIKWKQEISVLSFKWVILYQWKLFKNWRRRMILFFKQIPLALKRDNEFYRKNPINVKPFPIKFMFEKLTTRKEVGENEYKKQFGGFEIKIVFWLLIIDFTFNRYWSRPNYNDVDEVLTKYFVFHIWLNDWQIAKTLGKSGTNMATLFLWNSNDKWYGLYDFLKPFFIIRKLRMMAIIREIEIEEKICYDITSDPMCGCPGDFAEDSHRKINGLMYNYNRLKYSFD